MWSFSLMDSSTVALLNRFASLQDPRTGRAKRHHSHRRRHLWVSWVDVEMFGKAKKDLPPELPNGIPSHDSFGLIFARLDPVHSRPVSQSGCKQSTR